MIIKHLLLIGLLMGTSLSAESKRIFALNEQYFSESMPKEKSEKPQNGQMIGARYDVGDVIVSTNLARWSTGVLGSLRNRKDGYLIIDLKNPVLKWAVSANVSYKFLDRCREDSSYSIRIGAMNGESIYITTSGCDVVVGDNKFTLRKEESLDKVALNYFVTTKGENILVQLNGQTLVTLPRGEFDTLKTIELDMGVGSYNGSPSHIKNLTISQK